MRNLYLFVSSVEVKDPGTLKWKEGKKVLWSMSCKTCLLGFRTVPLRFLILVMTNKSLNRKNPLSFRPAGPEGIETNSNNENTRSLVTKSLIPSITFSNSRKVASRCPFSSASRSLQLRWTKISCTSLSASEHPLINVRNKKFYTK